MKKCSLLFLFFLPCISYGQNVAVANLFKTEALTNQFLKDGTVNQTEFNSKGSSLLFVNPAIKNQLEANLASTKANFTAEVAYFEPANFVINRPSDLDIYNKLLNFSLLEKALVRKNRGNPLPLFKNIQLYTDNTFKVKMASIPKVTVIPNKATYFISLKEEALGTLRFQLDLTYANGSFGLQLTNLDGAKTLGRKIANPGQLSISYSVQPLKEGGFLHLAQVAANIENMELAQKHIDLTSFFSRRIEAIKAWYFKELLNTPINYGRGYWGLVGNKA